MKKTLFPDSGRRALVAALAALAPLAVAQMNAAPANTNPGADQEARAWGDSVATETGTIPAARPGLPQIPRGAEGPLRSEAGRIASSDPSLRDSNPLTANGLWESVPGNRIVRPGTAGQ